MTIGDNEVPLYGLPGMDVWALLNLILCIAGAVLAVVILIVALVRRNKKQDEEEEYETEARHYRSDSEEEQEEEKRKKLRPVWLVLTAIAGILGVIVFILTEDMTNLMVWMDNWTIVNAIIFAVGVIGAIFAFKKVKEDKDEDNKELEDKVLENPTKLRGESQA